MKNTPDGIITCRLAVTVIFLSFIILHPPVAWGKPYREQSPVSEIGSAKIKLAGPPSFHRIDGQDRNLDDILLATQSPSAAILAIYAEPLSWKKFQSKKPGSEESGLSCHAVISTPAPMAGRNVTPDDFSRIKKDLAVNLASGLGQERDLGKELANVSDHKVERAVGRMEKFAVLDEEDAFITYRLESTLEIKLKDKSKAQISRSLIVTSTMLLNGKIINLQLTSNPKSAPSIDLDNVSRQWRETFIKANLRN